MIASLLRALTFDCLSCVDQDGFFDLPASKRKALIHEKLGTYPSSMTEYLSTVAKDQYVFDLVPLIRSQFQSFEQKQSPISSAKIDTSLLQPFSIGKETVQLSEAFVSDLFAFIAEQSPLTKVSQTKSNQFREAVVNFFTHEMTSFFDQRSIESIASVHTAIGAFLQRILDLQELVNLETSVAAFLKEAAGFQIATVLSPVSLTSEQRQEIRDDIRKKSEELIVLFRIDPSLAGGMALFMNGTLFDQTWLTRIRSLQTNR